MHGKRMALGVVCALVAACGGNDNPPFDLKVDTQAEPGVDFCQFKTFDFYDFSQVPGGIVPPPDAVIIGEQTSEEQITKELTALGLTLSSDSPDIRINRAYYADTSISLYETCIAGGGSWYGYWWGYDCGYWTAVQTNVGAFVVDLVDRVPNDLVFRGLAQSTVATGDAVQTIENRVTRAVDQMFADYAKLLEGCPAS